MAHIPLLGTGVGRVFFLFNAVSLCAHATMAYLTVAYNRHIEPPSLFQYSQTGSMKRTRVNIPALIAWVVLNGAVIIVWLGEGHRMARVSRYMLYYILFRVKVLSALDRTSSPLSDSCCTLLAQCALDFLLHKHFLA